MKLAANLAAFLVCVAAVCAVCYVVDSGQRKMTAVEAQR